MFYKKPITVLINSLPLLLPGSKIKLTILGVSFEVPIPALQQSIIESLGGNKITTEQISLLTKLNSEGRSPLERSLEYVGNVARPLRDSALIKVSGGGFLQSGDNFAKEIEITPLGRYVVVETAKKSS